MTAKTKTKSPQPSHGHQFKATIQLEAEAASLNWVAALVAVVVLLIGYVANRLTASHWSVINSYIAIPTVFIAVFTLIVFVLRPPERFNRGWFLRWSRGD